MSCTVGLPYEGTEEPERVGYLAGLMQSMACSFIGVADTIGVGTPLKVNAPSKRRATTPGRCVRPFP
jgi:hydroxymethylglutaryl-CoA lyase